MRRGTERFTHDLARALLARGHRPRLITSHPGAPLFRVEEGLPVQRNWRPPEGWLRELGFEDHLTHWPSTLISLGRSNSSVAHALHHSDGLAAGRWSARTGRPSVFSFMGIPAKEGFGQRRGLRRAITTAIHGTDAFVVLSRAAATRFENLLGARPLVIPPGVDTQVFTPGGARTEWPSIFCAGDAGEPRKRVPLLLAAFSVVRRRVPGARLVLSRPRSASAQAALRGLEGVEVRDVDSAEALVRAYRESWVSALPSYSEAFGLVLAEAMACGTPGVGSNLDGIPEVIDRPGVGRLFDGDEPAGLAQALLDAIELARDPNTRIACRARAEELSSERCAEAYVALYRELLEPARL